MTMEEARGLAAQAWCTTENSSKEMDAGLAQAFADILLREVNRTEIVMQATDGGPNPDHKPDTPSGD